MWNVSILMIYLRWRDIFVINAELFFKSLIVSSSNDCILCKVWCNHSVFAVLHVSSGENCVASFHQHIRHTTNIFQNTRWIYIPPWYHKDLGNPLSSWWEDTSVLEFQYGFLHFWICYLFLYNDNYLEDKLVIICRCVSKF